MGFILGILQTLGIKKEEIDFVLDLDKNKIKVFINTFTINYWYIFLLWLFSQLELGKFFAFIIIFLKCTLLGITLSLLIKSQALFGLGTYLFCMFGQFVIILPLMFYIVLNNGKKEKKLIISTIVIMIYSILNSLI